MPINSSVPLSFIYFCQHILPHTHVDLLLPWFSEGLAGEGALNKMQLPKVFSNRFKRLLITQME